MTSSQGFPKSSGDIMRFKALGQSCKRRFAELDQRPRPLGTSLKTTVGPPGIDEIAPAGLFPDDNAPGELFEFADTKVHEDAWRVRVNGSG